MYKITNKQTGFIQYRNAKDTANFVFKNNYTNYTIEQIKEYDFSKYTDIALRTLTITMFIILSFALLQF
ncbi:MAG: hypothetical protein GOVbin2669_14 [Prokaryotic dsDNA virus sp.]|nr:MAG: hypothetical protein GOVbin2669_14 [Prokaryotic dsDNA virus sp.]|tara:strand:+ start:7109 stop:7315 length:207 start_codon:yes stop_codon:yes gene_type:complete